MRTTRITSELIEQHVHEAQRLRAEAMRAALVALWRGVAPRVRRDDLPSQPAAAACR